MRHILTVLDQILEIIPLDETAVREDLDGHYRANRYRAPEAQGWEGVALSLFRHFEGREEPWIGEALKVWRGQE